MPKMYIIAGPNGAGKTTAAYTFLPNILEAKQFVNADEIARGISPFDPQSVSIQAGKIMLHRIQQLLIAKESFAIETTLATIGYLNTIAQAQSLGYEVILLYVWLSSEDLAKERVKKRVIKGGHNIPEEVIERRYRRGIVNLPNFIKAVSEWYIFDNSGSDYQLIAMQFDAKEIIVNFEVYNQIRKL